MNGLRAVISAQELAGRPTRPRRGETAERSGAKWAEGTPSEAKVSRKGGDASGEGG
jgi:hypothetical protein